MIFLWQIISEYEIQRELQKLQNIKRINTNCICHIWVMILYIVLIHQRQSTTEVAAQKTFLLAVRRMEVVLDKEIFQKIELMKSLLQKLSK